MLKVTKSSNKSVLDDVINHEHTAVTITGPDQPDQDDYGYVSSAANEFYQKYIEKVNFKNPLLLPSCSLLLSFSFL